MNRRPIIIWLSCMAIFILLLTGLLPRSAPLVMAGFTPTPRSPEPPHPPPPPVPPEGGGDDSGKKPEKIPAPPPPLELPTVAPSELPLPVLPETGEVSGLLVFRSLLPLFLGTGMIALAVWARRR